MVPGGLSYSALLWLVVLSHLSPIAPHGPSPSPLLRLMLVRVVNFFFLSFDFFFSLGLLVVVVLFRELNIPTVED